MSVKIIDNGLAPPEIVHSPVSMKPRCEIRAPALDLIFILDSSGSLRDQFPAEIDVIRRIIRHVTIGDTATRVMLVQFSGTQHLEFNFNKFTTREELLAALGVLRHVSGITRIGGAFEFTLEALRDPSNGMRDANVPKIIYLLSDGRTHDYPKDWEMANVVRRSIPNVDIWAYGTGNYVAMPALLNYTQDASAIVTNANLNTLESRFDPFHGIEICEKIPYAVRLALITYSGQTFVHFKFNDRQFSNNSAVISHLKTLRSIKGTTSTDVALNETFSLLKSRSPNDGLRQGVPKMVIILTDGHSARSPKETAEAMRADGITILAVSVTPRPYVDEAELLAITGDQTRVFTPKNAQNFEAELMKHVGFGCEGLELGPDAKPRVRGATDVTCDANSVTLTVRTQRPMHGLVYAQHFHDTPQCSLTSDASSREVSITFRDGTCGLSKTPAKNGDGYNFNITVILQFHPIIITRADQGLEVSCFYQQPLSPQEITRVSKNVADTDCTYRIHRYSPTQCVALDAKVGETLFHKWQCDSPPQFSYLVHDCYVKSDKERHTNSGQCRASQLTICKHCLDEEIELPFQMAMLIENFQEMSVFKFPGEGDVYFQCKISLCDMESGALPCITQVPPRCSKKRPVIAFREKRSASTDSQTPPIPPVLNIDQNAVDPSMVRSRRNIAQTKPGFYMTLDVETRYVEDMIV
ncbi:von Willebrand factor type A domain protein [Ostertagia ostertagi]